MRVLLTGATGLIGAAVAACLRPHHGLHTLGRQSGRVDEVVDLSDPLQLDRVKLPETECLVHCAGVIDEDFKADPMTAYKRATLGAEALARAAASSMRVSGDATVASAAVDVLTIAAAPGYAAGPTGWRIAPRLRAAGLAVRESEDPASVPAHGPLVVEVRDAWKRAELMSALLDVLRRRPDAVLLDVGWPTPVDLPVRGRICTHGTGSLAAAVATGLITGRDPSAAAQVLLRNTFDELATFEESS